MTETTNAIPSSPALYKVTRGTALKGRTVTTPYVAPEGLQALQHASRPGNRQVLARDIETGAEAMVKLANLERTFRTVEERELGREFTPEELAANERQWQIRYAGFTEEHKRTAILEGIDKIAARLERAAAELRQTLAYEGLDPAEKVLRVQHELAWLFPNLGSDSLSRDAIDWTVASCDLKRLLPEGIEPA